MMLDAPPPAALTTTYSQSGLMTLPAIQLRIAQAGPAYRDGLYVGAGADAYYGTVQVQANVQQGQLVSVEVLKFPNDRNTSRYINSQALPVLQQEAVSAQSGSVDVVSGATLTSDAFIKSLSDALRQAVGSQAPAANAA